MKVSRFTPAATTLFIVIHCLVWWVMTIGAKASLDGYGDMVEVYAWSQHWLAGSDKHPQFLPWVSKLWFMLAPRSVASFYLLSAVNLFMALLGMAALGRALKLHERQVIVAIALSALALPYLTLAGKLNMNTICLATWPWAAWAFVLATRRENSRRLAHAALLGLLTAITILSKYYAIVLLLPMLAWMLMPANRWLWRTAMPWLALLTFVVALAPHAWWLLHHSQALAYASQQGVGDGLDTAALYLFKFTIAPVFYWLVPLLLSVFLLVDGKPVERLTKLLRPSPKAQLLATLVVGPWLTTMFFGVIGMAVLSTPWAIPIGFAYTIHLVCHADENLLERNGPRLIKAFRLIWPAMIAAGLVAGMAGSIGGSDRHYKPAAKAAQAAIQQWQQRHGAPVRWAAAVHPAPSAQDDVNSFSFFSPVQIEALPAPPDRLPSHYPARAAWKSETGVIVCPLVRAPHDKPDCANAATNWAARHGLDSEPLKIRTQRTGWRFFRAMDYEQIFVFVWPRSNRT